MILLLAGAGSVGPVVRREFPLCRVVSAAIAPPAAVRASDWLDDPRAIDRALDGLPHRPPERVAVACDLPVDATSLALGLLSRLQWRVPRRNERSSSRTFDAILALHEQLHDLSKPLVAADLVHSRDAWQWVLRLDADADRAVQVAALFHDVERLASEADVRVEHLAPDYQVFKDAHAAGGAHRLRALLAGMLPDGELEDVRRLVVAHERRSDDARAALLADADALSFFSRNSDGYVDYFGVEQSRRKVAWTLARLSPRGRARLASIHLRPDVRRLVAEALRGGQPALEGAAP